MRPRTLAVGWIAAALVLGCARQPRPSSEAAWHGLTVDGLAQVEALSGGGTVQLPVPPGHWGELVAALGAAEKLEGQSLVGARSPVLRFLGLDGRELRLDVVGHSGWLFVEGDGGRALAPCPPLRQATKVALRLACASCADQIVVAKVEVPRGQKPVLEVERTLKGSAVPDGAIHVEGDPLPSPGDPDALCLALLRADWHGPGAPRFHRLLPVGTLWGHTDALEAKVRESIPLPEAWGEAVAGLRMGLRARSRAIVLGDDLRIEIAIQNVGDGPVSLVQHRLNIYDYYPNTRFRITAPDGSRLEVAKPEGPMKEDDGLLEATLQPGEVYIHTVRLGEWPVGPHRLLPGKGGQRVFTQPGDYEVVCTYSGGRKGLWSGTLTAAPLKLRLHTPPRKGSGGRI